MTDPIDPIQPDREPIAATAEPARRSRRWLLGRATAASLAIGALAGCGAPTASKGDAGPLVVRVINDRSAAESVTVRILDESGETVDETGYDVEPGITRSYRFDDAVEGRYSAVAIGDGWRTTADWDAAICGDFLATTRLSDDDRGEPETALSVECRDG